MQRPARSHLPAIDGLRAVAVVAVLLYHLRASLLPGGFVGVDIFFVISGFVVSLSIPQAEIRSLAGLLRFFYGRRVVRILPAMLTCIFVTTLLTILFVPVSWLNSKIEASGTAAILGYSNFVLASSDDTYFAPRTEFIPFTQTWSLGVEEQFYLAFPFLFLLFLLGRRMFSRALYAATTAASLTVAVVWGSTQENEAFYLIFARFWELGLGVLAFQLGASAALPNTARYARLFASLSLLCAAMIAYGLASTAPERTPFPGSIMPCVATALLLWLIRANGHAAILQRALTQPIMRTLGRISYSLYLWHWTVFVLLRWTCGLDGWRALLLAPALALAAAAASYRFVETPPRRALASGSFTAGTALAAGALALAVAYPVERNLWPLRSVISLSVVSRNRADWYPELPSRRQRPQCHEDIAPDPSRGLAVEQFHRVGCPTVATAPRLFVVGDSHASAYTAMIGIFVRETGANAWLYQQAGCAVLGVQPNDAVLCGHFVETALRDVAARAHHGDILFLPGLRVRRICEQFVCFGVESARTKMHEEAPWRAENLAATIPILAPVLNAGVTVIFEAPKPIMAAPNFRCADWFDRENPACADAAGIPRATIESLRAPVLDELRAAREALPGVRIWDPLPALCPGTMCTPSRNGNPLYFDADHLSGYANRLLAPQFMAFARATAP